MRIGSKLYYFSVGLLLVSLYAVTGCYKFEGDQTVPAYISIQAINLNTYYPEEGTNSSDIIDIWVYVDDGLLGVFEFPENDSLPAVFPVLAEGKHKLEIRPGIKLNGISSTRVPYPFYEPIIFEEFDFIRGTVQPLGNLTTSYLGTVNFAWMEDFEQPGLSIESTTWSDTVIKRTVPENNPIAFLSPDSRYSGVINLTFDKKEYGGNSFNSFETQTPGTVIIMELNFKTNNYIMVGLLIRDNYEVIEKDLLILNQCDEWKKIYINLGANLSLHPMAIDYKIIFRTGLENASSEAQILLDNIKIVYR
ncbi:MAG: hypothetical protein H8E34_02685 [Bacteroidetes bacterium]|nr:hypothetical protein [Bacteroidota bacterium]MBL6943978.1 hypothetical protein [Bacteroidales bacterium]